MNSKRKVYLTGHSHIDAVWLWDIDETKKVCKGTFERVLKLLDERDDFYYCQSMAQFYEWIEKESPELFERIKKHVKTGKWEIIGGMWVESDANLPSGESLVRQLLYGKNYFMDKFGVDVKVGLLPDTFGYCWTLPQIFKGAGIDYFVTSKLNWETNLHFKDVLFWWEGPDGSRILTFASPTGYNNVNYGDIYRHVKMTARKQPEIDTVFVPYGEGDHGGGLTHEMIELGLNGYNKDLEVFFSPAKKYFEEIENNKSDGLPIHKSELYLNTHRGTYTTQGRIKWLNRKGEIAMDKAEKFASISSLLGTEYPKAELDESWKKLLFNQFHDDLPGSSIVKVYEDAEKEFKEIFCASGNVKKTSMNHIASMVKTGDEGKSLVIFNSLAWAHTGVVKVDVSDLGSDSVSVKTIDGSSVEIQRINEGDKNFVAFIAENVPAIGYKTYLLEEGSEDYNDEINIGDAKAIENDFFRVEISDDGTIERILDKVNYKEVLQDQKSNGIFIYEDYTPLESAWNICLGKMEKLVSVESIKLVEDGEIRKVVETVHRYKQEERKDSVFTTRIILNKGVPRIDFELDVDWFAKYRTAKVGFNVNGRAEHVTYEIPYGSISRRVSESNEASPYEREKWEVPGLMWADYTPENSDYGVSLLNDCKYGFDVKDGFLRMTLLRSANVPKPLNITFENIESTITDQGSHKICYSIYPHKGDWKTALTQRAAAEFNNPLDTVIVESNKGVLPEEKSFVSYEGEGINISTLKKSEKEEAFIIRAYELFGKKSVAKIKTDFDIAGVYETDLMENEFREIAIKSPNNFNVEFKPNEIKTIKLRLKK